MPRKSLRRSLPAPALLAAWSGIAIAAQGVIAMRLLGMAGLWHVPAQENTRMVTEKWQAAFDGGLQAWRVAALGGAPLAMALAYARPVRRVARANRRRLAQGNPLLPRD
jgi:hypothetical protein